MAAVWLSAGSRGRLGRVKGAKGGSTLCLNRKKMRRLGWLMKHQVWYPIRRYTTVQKSQMKVPLKMWLEGVPPVEPMASRQLEQTAALPIIHPRGVAVMPDCHWGKGSTVGSVIPTKSAIIPAAVGVDIGCGMMAVKTSLSSKDLPDSLKRIRYAVEEAIPHGRTGGGGRGIDEGSWRNGKRDLSQKLSHSKRFSSWSGVFLSSRLTPFFFYSTLCDVSRGGELDVLDFGSGTPMDIQLRFRNELYPKFERLTDRHPKLRRGNLDNHLGTLGTGNHFVEMCLDEADDVWFMLHSGSRGVGNRVGMYFIELAKKDMRQHISDLPNTDLAYLSEGTAHFNDYIFAVEYVQHHKRSFFSQKNTPFPPSPPCLISS